MLSPVKTISLAAATLSALSALLAVPPSATASTTAPADSVVRPGDPRLRFMGHWGHTADAAITVNSGSELRFRFTGHRLTGLFDASTITVPSQIYVSIDGGARTLYKVDHDEIDFTPAALPGGRHTA